MRYLSLLRGINVGGQKKIKMAELRAMYETLGFTEVLSYIQSGNVIFSSPSATPKALEEMIWEQIKTTFGFEVSVFVYTASVIEEVAQRNPFLPQAPEAFKKLHLSFLSGVPSAEQWETVVAAKLETEALSWQGQFIYLYCPDGYGRTKLSNNFLERKLKLRATTRNWNSVLKLLELLKA